MPKTDQEILSEFDQAHELITVRNPYNTGIKDTKYKISEYTRREVTDRLILELLTDIRNELKSIRKATDTLPRD